MLAIISSVAKPMCWCWLPSTEMATLPAGTCPAGSVPNTRPGVLCADLTLLGPNPSICATVGGVCCCGGAPGQRLLLHIFKQAFPSHRSHQPSLFPVAYCRGSFIKLSAAILLQALVIRAKIGKSSKACRSKRSCLQVQRYHQVLQAHQVRSTSSCCLQAICSFSTKVFCTFHHAVIAV